MKKAMQVINFFRFKAPLNWLFIQSDRLQKEGATARLIALFNKFLRKVNYKLLMHPSLRQLVIDCCSKLGIKHALKRILVSAQNQIPHQESLLYEHHIKDFQDLSPRARQIYLHLKLVIEDKSNIGGN